LPWDRLTADGIEAIVVSPALIPVESGNKVKTDRRDSSKLAYLLKSGILKKVYVLSEEDRAVIGAIIILFVYGFIASRTRS
jgi:transposase